MLAVLRFIRLLDNGAFLQSPVNVDPGRIGRFLDSNAPAGVTASIHSMRGVLIVSLRNQRNEIPGTTGHYGDLTKYEADHFQ